MSFQPRDLNAIPLTLRTPQKRGEAGIDLNIKASIFFSDIVKTAPDDVLIKFRRVLEEELKRREIGW